MNSISANFMAYLSQLRKWRTTVFKLVFSFLIFEDFFTGRKPQELNPLNNISIIGIIGVMFIVAGALLRFWARGHFVKGKLFTTGPYSIVRHPLYLGSTLAMIGVLCILNHPLHWFIMIPLIIFFHGIAMFYEEQSLAARFGEQWQEYQKGVPAIIPSIKLSSLRDTAGGWSWTAFCNTTEKATSILLISLPVWLEMFEELCF